MDPETLLYLLGNDYIEEADLDELLEDGVITEATIEEATELIDEYGLVGTAAGIGVMGAMGYGAHRLLKRRKLAKLQQKKESVEEKAERWMQKAVKRPGSLHAWAAKHGAVTSRGTIDLAKASKLATTTRVKKKIQLAKTFRRFRPA